jgi:archaeal type IV pilus assembly protein PilA
MDYLPNVRVMYRKEREEAVSPVIGVILMVAITVILAAVIAAFVFGMAGGVSKTKNVAATARQVGADGIVVTWQGGPDNAAVKSYNVTLKDASPPQGNNLPPIVGNSTQWGLGTSSQDHVVVAVAFTDGTQQVVLDTYV